MKLTLKKQELKNLSSDLQDLPMEATPKVGGGISDAAGCPVTTGQPWSEVQCPADTNSELC